jgi:hypothetical protein
MIGNNDDGGMFREDGELSKKPRNNIFPHALDDSQFPPSQQGRVDESVIANGKTEALKRFLQLAVALDGDTLFNHKFRLS